ncbi:putative amidohydrolase-1 [Coleophoma crateriformis]|uniref:Putative amidohydrolase-1 n=1 Tax=Coleophoma crateriformis TaxID=565419 RepID=A0A3D8Q3J8_9HELO|nr:putative amidohydrolase-1 [Coleophoma crateriformis]
MAPSKIQELIASHPVDLASYVELYKHFHLHPELSNQEKETAETCAAHLARLADFEIHTHIGGYGLAAVLRNGPGHTILIRGEMDALPVLEQTGLPYSSTITALDAAGTKQPVMHACGHDMHMTCLLAATEVLVGLKDSWSGTLIILFQPAEERGTGAQAMVDDGLYRKIPVPDYVLGQHLMPLRAGSVGSKTGTIMAAADSFIVKLFGSGGHGSMPHRTIDPLMMAANVVVRLQNIISREIDPNDFGVLTVGKLHAGSAENIIADTAEIGIDIRSAQKATREKIIAGVRRIVQAEFIASGATKEPLITQTRTFPETFNDGQMASQVAVEFAQHFGDRFNVDIPRSNVAEDVSILATSQGKPCLFWFFGGVDEKLWDQKTLEGRLMEDVPANHSAYFAPVIAPTMQTGIDTLCIAALTFLTQK